MSETKQRLAYIDWMRGLACLLMFQTHCYDSWLSPAARKSSFFSWSQLGGTLPAPLFIFLAGVSFALVTGRMREKGAARSTVARTTILRGAEIFGLGMLFRLQEFALGYPYAPWTDLLRVDVLNILGLSMVLMGVLCWLVSLSTSPDAAANAPSLRLRNILAALAASALVALAAPPLWTTHRPRWLPWFFESYVNGVHIFATPQPWLFPLFPWAAFAFAGLAVGFLLFSDYAKKREPAVLASLLGAGILACFLALWIDALPVRLYAVYDFWHTSPNFFLFRCGLLLIILFLVYAWCRWGLALKGFSPVAQLGKTSLLVYWVHIEFVYGGMSILPKGKCTIARATAGLAVIFLAMLALSWARTRWSRSKRPA
ncbi:MAG: DUF1624 domain-containing protein [Acidobacteriia bacterium]|nr:DUF1624 domain-containing protein [Terriglobia bacterium]